MASSSRDLVENIIHHVFLPPKVPQKAPEDDIAFENDVALLKLLEQALVAFRPETNAEFASAIDNARHAVLQLRNLKDLAPEGLQKGINDLFKNGNTTKLHPNHASNVQKLIHMLQVATSPSTSLPKTLPFSPVATTMTTASCLSFLRSLLPTMPP